MDSKEKRKNDKKKRRKIRLEKRNHILAINRNNEINKLKFTINSFNLDIVPEQFVIEVTNCLQNIRLNDRDKFTKNGERIFKLVQEIGIKSFLDDARKISIEQSAMHYEYIVFTIGAVIFQELKKKNILLEYIPFTHFNIVPKDDQFVVIFRSLLRHRTKYGNVYYSSLKPTIRIDNKEYIVSFSRHATQRICERAIFDWQTYSGVHDSFLLLERCVKFDIVDNIGSYNKKYFITFYEPCSTYAGNMFYVNEILQEKEINSNFCFRIGYCPIGLNDNFACAITLLTPGMKGTPEDYLIKRANLSYENEKNIRNNVQDMISKNIWIHKKNLEAVKWFHQNGIPQVMQINEKIFQEFDWPKF